MIQDSKTPQAEELANTLQENKRFIPVWIAPYHDGMGRMIYGHFRTLTVETR